MMERWSYKPEVEGLSPSLGTMLRRGDMGTRADGGHGDGGTRGRGDAGTWRSDDHVEFRNPRVSASLCPRVSPSPRLPSLRFTTYRGVTHSGRTVTARNRGVPRGVSPHAPSHSHHRLRTRAARVPGIGLLNRTLKRRAERHEVQFLRGLPKITAV